MLNQKVSLLLITHNATNSPGLSRAPASLNILAEEDKEERKKKGEENNLRTIITVGASRRFGLLCQRRRGFTAHTTKASMRRGVCERAGEGCVWGGLTCASPDQTKV